MMKKALPTSLPRRSFLKQAAAISSAVVWPSLLGGCVLDDSGPSAQVPATSRLNVLVLGPFGELHKSWNGSSTLTLFRTDGTTVNYGRTHTELNVPTSVAAAPDGSFWVADTGNRRLLHLDGSLQPLGVITSVSGQRFSRPTGVALLPDGRIVVSDQQLGKVAIVDAGSGVGIWAGISADDHVGTGWRPHWDTETDHRILEDPKFVHFAPDGTLVTLDISVARLVLFSTSGVALDSIRLTGRPTDFAMGPDGTCYVCDRAGKTVNRVNLQTRQVDVVLSAEQATQFGGVPYRAVWRTGSGAELSNLMVSYR